MQSWRNRTLLHSIVGGRFKRHRRIGIGCGLLGPAQGQAVLDLAAAQGVTTIDHFYRRDDNSGTTNTIFEKINVGYFETVVRAASWGQTLLITTSTTRIWILFDDPVRRLPLAPTLMRPPVRI